jgi:hypothetical protein
MSRDNTLEQQPAFTPSFRVIKIIDFFEFSHPLKTTQIALAHQGLAKH